MTEEQIRTMKRHGMFIGLHGYDHYWLGKLPKEQMKKDLDKALDTLDEFIDRKHWVMNIRMAVIIKMCLIICAH